MVLGNCFLMMGRIIMGLLIKGLCMVMGDLYQLRNCIMRGRYGGMLLKGKVSVSMMQLITSIMENG